jgi:hypothetical protein
MISVHGTGDIRLRHLVTRAKLEARLPTTQQTPAGLLSHLHTVSTQLLILVAWEIAADSRHEASLISHRCTT